MTEPASVRAKMRCPECGSIKVSRNGTARSNFNVEIQRYVCCSCGRRSSDLHDLKKAKAVADNYLSYESLKVKDNINRDSQVCVT